MWPQQLCLILKIVSVKISFNELFCQNTVFADSFEIIFQNYSVILNLLILNSFLSHRYNFTVLFQSQF